MAAPVRRSPSTPGLTVATSTHTATQHPLLVESHEHGCAKLPHSSGYPATENDGISSSVIIHLDYAVLKGHFPLLSLGNFRVISEEEFLAEKKRALFCLVIGVPISSLDPFFCSTVTEVRPPSEVMSFLLLCGARMQQLSLSGAVETIDGAAFRQGSQSNEWRMRWISADKMRQRALVHRRLQSGKSKCDAFGPFGKSRTIWVKTRQSNSSRESSSTPY